MTFTKEQVQQIEATAKEVLWPIVWTPLRARKHFEEKITPDVVLTLARMALAGMEAEPYGYVHKAIYESQGSCGLSNDQEAHRDSSTHIAVYAAPQPLTTSERAELENYRNTQQVVPELKPIGYLFVSDQGAVAYSPTDWGMAGFNLAGQIFGNIDACRAAMLQGAENVESRCSNSPVIQDGWVMVPVEPTDAMVEAMYKHQLSMRGALKAAIAAAPQQEAE